MMMTWEAYERLIFTEAAFFKKRAEIAKIIGDFRRDAERTPSPMGDDLLLAHKILRKIYG